MNAKRQSWRPVPLAIFFIAAGVLHFVRPEFYAQIIPPYLPWPLALVFISGACEIVGGVAVLWPPARRWAGYGLIALLVAVFPANVQMALDPKPIAGWDVPAWLLWLRLPFQGVLIAWVAWATRNRNATGSP